MRAKLLWLLPATSLSPFIACLLSVRCVTRGVSVLKDIPMPCPCMTFTSIHIAFREREDGQWQTGDRYCWPEMDSHVPSSTSTSCLSHSSASWVLHQQSILPHPFFLAHSRFMLCGQRGSNRDSVEWMEHDPLQDVSCEVPHAPLPPGENAVRLRQTAILFSQSTCKGKPLLALGPMWPDHRA